RVDEVLDAELRREAERGGEDLPRVLERAVEGPQEGQGDQQRPVREGRRGGGSERAVPAGEALGRGALAPPARPGVRRRRGCRGGVGITAYEVSSFRRRPNRMITAIR